MGTVSLKSILEIEQIDDLIFRGFTPQGGTGRVYGGQVIAQGLSAASHTVENRPCHSLHAYFLRPGDRSKPIIYDVDIDPIFKYLGFEWNRLSHIFIFVYKMLTV